VLRCIPFRIAQIAGLVGLLFAGDTLFQDSIGRTDFPGGDFHQLVSAIRERLFTLPEETIVLPGHGEPTTIGYEIKNNPYVSGNNEIPY
jgi:glyoxylase-like metal-dependent hydrolase (beta-lactamase superfamily II)